MFDDPNRRLRELEQALKKAEEPEIMEEEEDWLQEAKDLLGEEEAPRRRQKPESVNFPRMKYAHEEMKESDALYVEKPRRKGAFPYVVLALLELIGILLVMVWWTRWIS